MVGELFSAGSQLAEAVRRIGDDSINSANVYLGEGEFMHVGVSGNLTVARRQDLDESSALASPFSA